MILAPATYLGMSASEREQWHRDHPQGLPKPKTGLPDMNAPTPAQLVAMTTVQQALSSRTPWLDPHVTYEALGDRVFCTAHCRTEQEQLQVLLAFSAIPNVGMSSTGNPLTATVIIQQS